MKNQCNIIRDILPLYAEDMVSDDTVSFVDEHLETCSECSNIYEDMKSGTITSTKNNNVLEAEVINVLKKTRRKFVKRFCIISLSICLGVVAVLATLQVFPVHKVFMQKWNECFTMEERMMLAYIGTPGDRKIAQGVINQAEIAFSDFSHTYEENLQLYGELGRYAHDSSANIIHENHFIELMSAHIDDNHGYIWILYSQEARTNDMRTIHGTKDKLSLWEVEKNSDGEWKVISINEHA